MTTDHPKREWRFYIIWVPIAAVGDGLCWCTADYFWVHNDNKTGDFFFWLFLVVVLASVAKLIIKQWKRPRIIWPVVTILSLISGVLIILHSRSDSLQSESSVKVANLAPSDNSDANFEKKWHPPDLPNNCTNVLFSFGGQQMNIPILVAEISHENTGTKFLIKDLPPLFLTDLDKMTNYSPRNRNLWVRWASAKTTIGSNTIDMPMLPSVISNRLFVYAETPFGNEKRNILMSDDLDSQLPRLWDRNYNSNKFEIVNEFTNPVFQVIYKKPNEIQVNGIFFVNSNSVYVSFGGAPVLLTMTGFKVMDLKTMQETNVPSIPEALGVSTMGEVITNAFYNLQFTDQKAIFQYPSNRHPGGLAQ